MTVPRLSRYEVEEEVGRGGMSVVYRAHDRQLDREVAIKVLHGFLARDDDARRRFRREALAVARLRHPSIVEIHDSSEPGADVAYLVMELIEGQTLRAWLEAHGPPAVPELSAAIALVLARALRHAHEQGILHRDLKPENVMVTASGHLKLMDFGIAQIIGAGSRVTATGTLLGSPAHMAPEVIDGAAPDHRSDLFSLGTILYWLITGVLPYDAPNPSALFRRILEGNREPVQMLAPRVGNGLARVVDKALEASVERRYQDVSELEAELEAEVKRAGLEPTEALLRSVLRAPGDTARALEPGLAERLLDEGRRALEAGARSRAADRLNRALAFRPGDPEATRLLARASARPSRRRAAAAAAAGVTLAALAAGVVAARGPAPAERVPSAPAPAGDPSEGAGGSPPARAARPSEEASPRGAPASAPVATLPPPSGDASARARLGPTRGSPSGAHLRAGLPPRGRIPSGRREISRAPEQDRAERDRRGATPPTQPRAGPRALAGPSSRFAPRPGAGSTPAEQGEVSVRAGAKRPPSSARALSAAPGAGRGAAPEGTTPAPEAGRSAAPEGTTPPPAPEAGRGAATEGTTPTPAPEAGRRPERAPEGPPTSAGQRPAQRSAERAPEEPPSPGAPAQTPPGPRSGPAERDAGPEAERARPALVVLRVRIGRTFANIRLNGQVALENRYRGELKLPPGVHRVEVVKPGLGRFRPRVVEVSPSGELFERVSGGQRKALVDGVLDFRVPITAEQAAETPGWTSG